MINLEVTDSSGQAVENAIINVIQAESGDTLQVCGNYECTEGFKGNYTLFHDGLMNEVSFEGDIYTVTGSAEQGSFREDFVFAKNECHVYKKSGPDAVILK